MAVTYYALLTTIGAGKLANATALGTTLKITQLALGDGGGNVPTPDASRTQLVNEVRRAPLNRLSVDPANSSQIIAEQVIPEDVGGWWIREMGLYDEAGALIAYANCAPSYKPQLAEGSGRTQTVRIVLIVSNAASVELKIDPSVVLATREYVDNSIVTALNRLDYKQSVRVATTASITLSGLQTVDGVALAAGDRVLVKNQTNAVDNGLYVVATSAWKRATDADENSEVTPGLTVTVESGTAQADSVWQLVTDGTIVLGTTALAFQNITNGLAKLASPSFTGTPTAPTAASERNDTAVATTAFVWNFLRDKVGLGAVSTGPSMADIDDVSLPAGLYYVSSTTVGAPVSSSGVVLHKIYGVAGFQLFQPISSDRLLFRRRSASAWLSWQELTTQASLSAALGAVGLGASSYQPNWPNASLDDCSNVVSGIYRSIATTTGIPVGYSPTLTVQFWVRSADQAGVFQAIQCVQDTNSGRSGWRSCTGNGSAAAPIWSAWKDIAVTDSPAFTGVPTAPTAAAGVNSTQLATTAFVQTAIAPMAPRSSPVLTGNPTAPTPAQFDNDTSLATTAFVQRAIGNMASVLYVSAATTLTAADTGKYVLASGASGYNIVLPAIAAVIEGATLEIGSSNAAALVLQAQGTDKIYPLTGGLMASFVLGPGENICLIKSGGSWIISSGSASNALAKSFGASLANAGFQRLPSGLIIQWGGFISGADGIANVAWPIPFPNGVGSVTAVGRWVATGLPVYVGINNRTNTAGVFYCVDKNGAPGTMGFDWMAIGY